MWMMNNRQERNEYKKEKKRYIMNKRQKKNDQKKKIKENVYGDE